MRRTTQLGQARDAMSSAIMRSVVTPARERAGRPPDGAPHGARAVLPLALGQAPSKHKAPLWTWFIGLSVEERERVVCIEDRTAVTLLRQMYQKRARDGEGLFFNVDDQPSEPSAEPCFSRLRRLAHLCAYPDFLLRADRQLEDAIRMCDTQQYLDTITIEASLLRDPSEIYRLFMIATRGGFLSAPCKVRALRPPPRSPLARRTPRTHLSAPLSLFQDPMSASP